MDFANCGSFDSNKELEKVIFTVEETGRVWLCERFRLFGVWGREKRDLANICGSMGNFRSILTKELCASTRKCFDRKLHSSVSTVLSGCRVSADNTCQPIFALI